MAEACKHMITVIHKETVYNLIYVPAKDSLLVKVKEKSIEEQLNLEEFGIEDILKLGKLVQLAYFGVVAHADLQIKVRPALSDVNELCDNVIHTLNGFKRSLHGAVIRIQTVYKYLENSSETNALEIIKELQPVSHKVIQDSSTLYQECWEKARHLLEMHHTAEREKQTVVDDARKQEEELSNNKKEKFKCDILIKKSYKIIKNENKKIEGFCKSKSNIYKGKTKFEEKCEIELEKARRECKKQLNKLESEFNASIEKLSKKSKQKFHSHSETDNDKKTAAAAGYTKPVDQHSQVDDKLMQEKKQHVVLDDQNQGNNDKKPINKDHQFAQDNDNKESHENTGCACNTDISEKKHTSIPKFGDDLTFSKNSDSEMQLIAAVDSAAKNQLQTVQETVQEASAISQVKHVKGTTTKEKQASERQEMGQIVVHNHENKTNSLATSGNGDTKNTGKEKERSIEEQKEILRQKYNHSEQQIKLKAQNSEADIQEKYRVEAKKLDDKLEKLNQQLTNSEAVIKENEQLIRGYQQKLPRLSEIIAEQTKVKDLNKMLIECITHVIAALYSVGSIMTKLGNFLRDFTALCCQLNDPTLFTQIKFLQKNSKIWKSNTFKLVMLDCYGNFVAFTNICNTAVNFITKAQKEVYQNVCKELTKNESFEFVLKNAPNIVHQLELD